MSDRDRAADVRVVIVGGGGTGSALLHDLTQRGFACRLFERGELTSGTTGRHHGQLHSGARYAVGDVEIARECAQEVAILRRIAADSIEMNYGLFLALSDDDEAYAETFVAACQAAGIAVRRVAVDEALRYEPRINPRARLAYLVPDGTIDAYRLPLQFLASAAAEGALAHPFCEVTGIRTKQGMVTGVSVFDYTKRREKSWPADIVINAAGPWAGRVAQTAGVDLPVTPAAGTMVAVRRRLCNMVVSHLHPPGDGDIIVPQRGLSIIGSTQWETDDPDGVVTPEGDIEWLRVRADELLPGFSDEPFHAAWTAVRPLAGRSAGGGRALSRGFTVVPPGRCGPGGFYSVVGGKATTLRAMAQAVADRVCDDLDLAIAGRTHATPLRPHRDYFRRNIA